MDYSINFVNNWDLYHLVNNFFYHIRGLSQFLNDSFHRYYLLNYFINLNYSIIVVRDLIVYNLHVFLDKKFLHDSVSCLYSSWSFHFYLNDSISYPIYLMNNRDNGFNRHKFLFNKCCGNRNLNWNNSFDLELEESLIFNHIWYRFLNNELNWNFFSLDCNSGRLLDNFYPNSFNFVLVDNNSISINVMWHLYSFNNIVGNLNLLNFLNFKWDLYYTLNLSDLGLIYYSFYDFLHYFFDFNNFLYYSWNRNYFLHYFFYLHNPWHLDQFFNHFFNNKWSWDQLLSNSFIRNDFLSNDILRVLLFYNMDLWFGNLNYPLLE